jgi:hypothetical protein
MATKYAATMIPQMTPALIAIMNPVDTSSRT